MKRVIVHLDESLDAELAREAARSGESKAALLRRAARVLLDQRRRSDDDPPTTTSTVEDRHDLARAVQPAPAILTTELVLGETWTLVNRRVGHRAAVACVRAVRALPRVVVEPVSDDDHAAAWRWLERHDEREYSFVDALSFAVMRGHRITEALAFDGDVAAAGFVEVRPDR